eukprot:CAMPEP_0202712258 /NCGR_PEP_ID=MMETSP1385-20130828/36148_1 /ASSEMBLY_ACC=CAM_ASM_000861 /TAXON_ID=933848 /ORGANISM="Elphidium margaritaceum" /LENGTH=656 /DNA_ID=CAMNT_0049372229 /DNA_START=22 /DNA_END=1992 /DNA_ORIENTATION=+
MKPAALIVVVSIATAAIVPNEEWEEYFDHHTYLRPSEDYRLYWKLLEDERVEIGIEAETTGWVGFGLSDDQTMGGADIILGWVDDSDAKTYLQRRHSVSIYNRNPVFDEDLSDDLVEASQENGVTRLRFTRQLFPCADDENHFVKQVMMGTSFVIFAYNQEDPICTDSDDEQCMPAQHDWQSMGSQSINFFSGESSVVTMPNNTEHFDFLMDNYEVPSSDTTYWCKFLSLPQPITNASHLIRVDPVVQEGNEAAVHHIVLYWCKDFDPEYVGHAAVCDDVANMAGKDCRSEMILNIWAVGGSDFYFPEHVGLPIEGLQYVLMEIHYDNPDELEGIVDSSGLRIYWTEDLREYDAGIFAVGADYPATFIPGDMDAAVLNSFHSAPQCSLNSDMPEQGIHAFVGLLHAHTIGTALKMRHIRDNVELRPLLQNEQYDFNYQQWTNLPQEVDIYPGDEFVCECWYKTTRSYPTYGGESTQDEMCICFVFYYPVTNFFGSQGYFTDNEYEEFFQTAIDNGWWNGTTSWTLNEANKTAYYYDGSNPDAVDHYVAFQAKEERSIKCPGCPNGTCDDYIIPQARDDFVELPDDNFGNCDDAAQHTGDNDDQALTDTQIVVIAVTAAVVVLVVLVGAIVCYKRKQKAKVAPPYSQMADQYGTATK